LYLPYSRAIGVRSGLPDWRNFAGRRAVRILPGYWLALTILAIGPLSASVQTPAWWRYYGLTQIYDPDTALSGLGVAWSLCVEVTFYATLPLFARGVVRLVRDRDPIRSQLWLIAALAGASLALRMVLARSLVGPITHGSTAATALPGALDWFTLGMALAVLRASWEAGIGIARPLAKLAANPLLCWCLALALFCLGMPWQHGDLFLPLYGLPTHCAIGLASAALLLPAVGVGDCAPGVRGAPLALLRSSSMVWLGTISYGIYLWHVSALQQIAGYTSAAAVPASAAFTVRLLVEGVAAGVALGAASWYLVERPAQRRWRARRGTPLAVAA
jgi:peptidoglycan/LPS O-acetylase OafA/YrhL